jgi:hypothetical protein
VGWLFELAVQFVAEAFGEAVAKKRAWWVELVATLGCLLAMGLVMLAVWFLFVLIRR